MYIDRKKLPEAGERTTRKKESEQSSELAQVLTVVLFQPVRVEKSCGIEERPQKDITSGVGPSWP